MVARAARLPRRHPHHIGLTALVAGLASGGAGAAPIGIEALMLAAAATAGALAALRSPALGLAFAALLVTGGALGAARVAAIDAPAARVASGTPIESTAVLLERPRPSAFGSSAEIELVGGEAHGARLVARVSGEEGWPDMADPGTELAVTGFVRPPDTRPGAGLDWAAHLRRRGVAGELHVDSVHATGGRRGGLAGAVDAVRERGERALSAGVAAPQEALIRGMVLGQDEAIDELVRDDFRASGLAHILAVSGQNVMLLGLLAMPVLATLGLGPRARLAALLALIALYVPLAGAGPSLQRAGATGAAGLLAVALGRPASRWYGLLAAAAATLALNPRVVGDAGWQLSFAAVAGILLLGPALRRPLGGLPPLLASGTAITVSATVATAPLLAHHFGQVSAASLPANLLALPAVAPAMWIGMVQIALGQLGAAGEPVGWGAMSLVTLLGAVNGVMLAYLAELARRFGEMPGAELAVGLESPLKVAVAYAAIGAGAVAARRAARRLGPSATALAGWWRTAARSTRAGIVLAAAAAVLAVTAEATAPGGPPDRLTVSFLDVGQGDATLVQHPDGGSVLIDGGPDEARVYRLLRDAGVDHLGMVVATHAAADHHPGLLEVLERIPVDLLLEGGDGTSDPSFDALLAEADRQGVRRLAARAGQTFRVGGLTVSVIWPTPRGPGPPPEDANLRAVTTVIRAGDFELLASGDAESPSLAPLDLPDVDVLKVPHHGSDDPGLPALLERLEPEVAAIGVGADNGYGHPHPSTLEALQQAGARVYRTDHDGTVSLTVAGGEMHVATEH